MVLRLRSSRASAPRSIEALKQKFDDRDDNIPCLRRLSEEEIAAREADRFSAIEHLSEPEMIAMMQMSHSLRHQTIWHAERQRFSVPPFTLSTFYALRDKGLAYKPEGKTFHILTTEGQQLADTVADYLVRQNSVHAPYIARTHEAAEKVCCTCGWASSYRRWGNTQRKANNAFLQHLRTVTAINDMATALVPRHVGERE